MQHNIGMIVLDKQQRKIMRLVVLNINQNNVNKNNKHRLR